MLSAHMASVWDFAIVMLHIFIDVWFPEDQHIVH